MSKDFSRMMHDIKAENAMLKEKNEWLIENLLKSTEAPRCQLKCSKCGLIHALGKVRGWKPVFGEVTESSSWIYPDGRPVGNSDSIVCRSCKEPIVLETKYVSFPEQYYPQLHPSA